MDLSNSMANLNLRTVVVLTLLVAGVSSAATGYHMYHIGYNEGYSAQKQTDTRMATNLTLQPEANTTVTWYSANDSNQAEPLLNLSLVDEC